MKKSVKIALHSDLHLELQQYPNNFLSGKKPDVLILAGDIGKISSIDRKLRLLAESFPGRHIIFVAGNHEFYNNKDMDTEIAELKKSLASEPFIHFLNRDVVEIEGVRFIGCTGWSRMLHFGPEKLEEVKRLAGDCINDFLQIKYYGRTFEPDDCYQLGRRDHAFLKKALEEKSELPTVVVTHFSPTMETRNMKFPVNEIAAYFSNDYDDLIEKHQPAFWCFGHTHYNVDLLVGKTRIISNQKGYGRECIDSYNPNFIFEVPVSYQ